MTFTNQIAVTPKEDGPNGNPANGTTKHRPCLRCNEMFVSEWSGVRICRRCKGKAAWRNSEPYQRRLTSP